MADEKEPTTLPGTADRNEKHEHVWQGMVSGDGNAQQKFQACSICGATKKERD